MSPLNFTVSVTYKCNSRCRTCNIYEKKVPEFTLNEFDRTFRSIGRGPYWFTMSGGEPFLRKDIVDICGSVYENCGPKIINIPTNGILCDVIPEKVERIVKNSPGSQIIINVSFDEIGERHDEIRNVKDNFVKAKQTFTRLKALHLSNLTVGMHTVISRFNVNNFERIYEELNLMEPDSYITEIAEERVELGNAGRDITPSLDDYSKAVDFLSEKIRQKRHDGISGITQAFRLQYYDLVKRILKEKRQVLPCYAGHISAQISPDGELWACCIRAESMGNLREAGYDFRKVWFSRRAKEMRKHIRGKRCHCPLANACYTNMLVSYRTMAAVAGRIAAGKVKKYLHNKRDGKGSGTAIYS
jgi:MoaA/NifB/PqqE/SkfB family radical SAM enzyme